MSAPTSVATRGMDHPALAAIVTIVTAAWSNDGSAEAAPSTYLDKKDEVVTLDVRFGALSDGTGYAARTTLEAKAKNIRVVLENSGHRPLAR